MITDIISYDGHTFAPNYEIGFTAESEPRLPEADARMLERIGAWPVIVALQRNPHRLALMIRIVGENRDVLRSQLFRWFDPEAEDPKVLVAENHDETRMYVEALCEELRVYGDQRHDEAFVATLAVSGDVRWRTTTEEEDTWSITASGQTNVISNGGEDEAYPTFEITPTASKGTGFGYKRYVLLTWRAPGEGRNYPIRLGPLDTAQIVDEGKMNANGADLRVFVDGREVPRHLVDMNTANTYIWFTSYWIDWQAMPELELTASIPSTGTVTFIELDDAEEMGRLPRRGFVRINNEVFSYGDKDAVNVRLTDVERAVWNTSGAAHSAGDDVFWMQHEVQVLYGSDVLTIPPTYENTEPYFEIDQSNNTQWRYEVFGEWLGFWHEVPDIDRPGRWDRWGNRTLSGDGGVYTGTQRTQASPYTVAGAWLDELHSGAYGWSLSNPCGIVNAAWSDGKKRAEDTDEFVVELRYWIRGESWWSNQARLSAPTTANTWESWSESAAASDWDPAGVIAIIAYFVPQDVEVGTVVVSLNGDETPVTSIQDEQGNYNLSCTITNETTGEAIDVDFDTTLNEALIIDTEARTVVYGLDNSSQFQAISLDSSRRQWLRLLPGNNTLEFVDEGTEAVTLVTSYEERYY